jgi:DnaJ-class molecular chaperone
VLKELHLILNFKEYDVLSVHRVPITKAILGGKECIKTLYGDVYSNLPPKVAPNQKFEIEGYGLPDPRNANKKGKHIVKIEYVMPGFLTQKEKTLWQEFKNLSNI